MCAHWVSKSNTVCKNLLRWKFFESHKKINALFHFACNRAKERNCLCVLSIDKNPFLIFAEFFQIHYLFHLFPYFQKKSLIYFLFSTDCNLDPTDFSKEHKLFICTRYSQSRVTCSSHGCCDDHSFHHSLDPIFNSFINRGFWRSSL